MTQPSLLEAIPDTVPKRVSLNDRLAAYFRARPETWIDGLELERIAGRYAWRSRCSDIRRKFGMTIDNRQRHVTVEERTFTVSEYRYRP